MCGFAREFGEPGRNRTFNQQIKSLLLCQLSYGPTEGSSAKRLWRARQDSNLRPLAPEANALSS
jgi:hypothetical protein